MSRTRSESGGTLGLIAAITIILIIVGIGIFYLIQLLGGERELRHAADSGDLNVAKQAILRPNIALQAAAPENGFLLLVDTVDNRQVVDLQVFNRLVGQTLLIAMNATAENTPLAQRDATAVIKALHGSGGVADRLGQQLGASANKQGFFQGLSFSNSTNMLNNNPLAQTYGQYDTAWMQQRPGDVGASNLQVPVQAQIPTGYPSNGISAPSIVYSVATVPSTNNLNSTQPVTVGNPPGAAANHYVRGYQEYKFANIGNIMAVPVQPENQPHLVSSADFNVQLQAPLPKATIVPPNAFQTGASLKTRTTLAPATQVSRALVGVLTTQYAPSIPGGYIRIKNPTGVGSNQTLGDINNVLNGQLDPTQGITVASNGFFGAPGPMEAWISYNSTPHPGSPNGVPPGQNLNTTDPTQMVFDSNGNQVTSPAIAHTIGTGPCTSCTDGNTVSASPSTQCANALQAFYKAYPYGDTSNTPASPPTAPSGLTAVEATKCAVMAQYPSCGNLSVPPGATTSGMQYYINPNCQPPAGSTTFPDCAWPANSGSSGLRCSISNPGTLAQLLKQCGNQSTTTVTAFLRQRLSQINPTAAMTSIAGGQYKVDTDVQTVLQNCLVPMNGNQFVYVYYTFDKNGNGTVHPNAADYANGPIISQTVPGLLPTTGAADGKAQPYSTTYLVQQDTNGYLVNSHHDHNIHDQLFKCPSGTTQATEQATLIPSSGYNNLLGEIDFQEKVTFPVGQPYMCCPD